MMKAAMISSYGDGPDVVSVEEVEKPHRKSKNDVLIKVLAASISMGDCHLKSGRISFVMNPALPYIPGQDSCGIIEDIDDSTSKKTGLNVGDVVVAHSEDPDKGQLAEYVLVDAFSCVKKPESMSNETAAACIWGTTGRMAVSLGKVKSDSRVLVLGGSGGVGTYAVQFAKKKGAFVAATSTQEDMLKELGVDKVINYKEVNWWELEEFQKNPFDTIIDVRGTSFYKASTNKVIKSRKDGGVFVAVTGDDPSPTLKTFSAVFSFFSKLLWRPLWTRSGFWRTTYPTCTPFVCIPDKPMLTEYFRELDELKIETVFDPSGPFRLTSEGVKKAFNLIESHHTHGRVVFQIAKN